MYCEEEKISLSGLTFFSIYSINVKVCFHVVVEGNLPVSNNIMWTGDWRVQCTGADYLV